MYQERKIHSGLVGGLLLLAAVVMLLFAVRPAHKASSELKTKVATAQAELHKRTGEGLAGSDRTQDISEVQLKDLNQSIPEGLEQNRLLDDLVGIAKKSEVTFNALTFSLGQSGGIPSITISGGFTGSPANITRFLKLIEVNPRKMVIRDAGIARTAPNETRAGPEGTSANSASAVNLTVTIQAFYRL